MAGKRDEHLNMRVSARARWILTELQDRTGLSQASVVELLLREEAVRRGIQIPRYQEDAALKQEQEKLAASIRSLEGAMGGLKRDEKRQKEIEELRSRLAKLEAQG